MYKAMSVTHSISECFTSISSSLCYISLHWHFEISLEFLGGFWYFPCYFLFNNKLKNELKRKRVKIKTNVIALIRWTANERRERKKNHNDRGRVPLILAVEMDFVAKTVQIMFGIVHWRWANMKPSEEIEKEKDGKPKICQCDCPLLHGATFVSQGSRFLSLCWHRWITDLRCERMCYIRTHFYTFTYRLCMYNTWYTVGTSIYHPYLTNSNSNASNFVGLIFGIAFDQNVSAYRIDLIQNTPPCLYICHQCLLK